MLRSRRIALIATIAVLGLSACGDAGSTISGAKTPAVIHLGAAGARDTAAAPEGGAGDKMTILQDITYVFDGNYPDLGATGKSWTLPAGTAVDKAVVARIAKLLGVEGDVRQLSADQGGGWMVGAADYSTASLTVSNDGMLSWWYNPAPMAPVAGGCAMPSDTVGGTSAGSETLNPAGATSGTDAVAPDTAVAPPDSIVVDPIPVDPVPCETPAPPANVPDKAAATVKAEQFLTDLGLDPSNYELTAYADDYGANVTAWLLLDGHRSPIQVNIGYGAEGAVVWASGSLAVPQASDEYPLVTPEEGLARLNEQNGMWMAGFGGGGVLRGMAGDVTSKAIASGVGVGGGTIQAAPPASDVAVSTGDVTSSNTGGGISVAPVPICDPAADCVIEPGTMAPAEPITVHLTGVRLDITMVWADDGTVWLLPAYTFTSADGGEHTVIAVDDQYIAQPDPAPVDTVTTDVPGTDVTAPVDTTPVDTTPVTDLPQALDPAAVAKTLVGLTIDEATKLADGNGWAIRVSTLDGEGQMLTDDYSPTRVNVAVEAGLVVGIDSIG